MLQGVKMFGFLEEVSNMSGLPFDIINKGFRVINLSNRAVYIEGFVALVEVEKTEITIKLKKGIVKILGEELKIKNMNLNTILVVGKVYNMVID